MSKDNKSVKENRRFWKITYEVRMKTEQLNKSRRNNMRYNEKKKANEHSRWTNKKRR